MIPWDTTASSQVVVQFTIQPPTDIFFCSTCGAGRYVHCHWHWSNRAHMIPWDTNASSQVVVQFTIQPPTDIPFCSTRGAGCYVPSSSAPRPSISTDDFIMDSRHSDQQLERWYVLFHCLIQCARFNPKFVHDMT